MRRRGERQANTAAGSRVTSVTPELAALTTALESAGTAERAVQEKRYLRSDLRHLGVPVPEVRRAARSLGRAVPAGRSDLIATAAALWRQPVHEYRLAAIELLRARAAEVTAADLPMLQTWLARAGTWALVDPLSLLVGDLARRDRTVLDATEGWTVAEQRWLRRAALLALLPGLRADDPGYLTRLLRYGDALAGDADVVVRKALGWALRETSRRHPEAVASWVRRRAGALPAVTWREAVRHLPERDREELVALCRRPAAAPSPSPARRVP